MENGQVIVETMKEFNGRNFMANGPLLVCDLTGLPTTFQDVPLGRHGIEKVPGGKTTKPHAHDFPSFYKTENLNIVVNGIVHFLPERAAVIVLPGIQHNWAPQNGEDGIVGSIDPRHEKLEIVPEVQL